MPSASRLRCALLNAACSGPSKEMQKENGISYN
jgi:hypothetical protein